MERRMFLRFLPALFAARAVASAPPMPSFAGTWHQSNDRCVPVRTGETVLLIEHHDPVLVVETQATRASGSARHAVQRYRTDGSTSVSTGTDGDEFHTSIVWSGESLVFSVEEHEDGRILHAQEWWTLIENDATLRRERRSLTAPASGAEKQVLIYTRQPRVL